MRVLLDETVCETNADSVVQAIAHAAAVAQERGRLIVEVTVDGQLWGSERLGAASHAATSAKEIRLTSADPRQLVSQTFRDAARELTNADGLQRSAAELLQSGQTQLAMEKLNEALGIWGSVQQAVSMGVELADLDLNQCRIAVAHASKGQSVAAEAVIDQLNAHLRQIRAALGNKDMVALADTLLYDLPPVVRQWQDMLEDLQAILEGQGEGS